MEIVHVAGHDRPQIRGRLALKLSLSLVSAQGVACLLYTSITLSSGISGTINSAQIARDEMAERYPDRRITVVDSLSASSGYGLLVDTAWEKMQAGCGYDELCAWLLAYHSNLHHWFFTSDLSHLKRGGRISASAAFFGGMRCV